MAAPRVNTRARKLATANSTHPMAKVMNDATPLHKPSTPRPPGSQAAPVDGASVFFMWISPSLSRARGVFILPSHRARRLTNYLKTLTIGYHRR